MSSLQKMLFPSQQVFVPSCEDLILGRDYKNLSKEKNPNAGKQ